MSAVLAADTVAPKPARPDAGVAQAARAAAAEVEAAPKKAEKLLSAEDRLALSRMQLRAAMLEIAHPAPKPSILGEGMGGVVQSWLDKAKAIPGASIVLASVESWWKEHPLHTAGVVATEASRSFVQPIVRRNPQSFVLGAAALGAVFMLTKPWRWLLRPALFVGLVPQLLSHAMKQVPLDAAMRMAGAALGKKRAPAVTRPVTPRR